MVLEPRSNSKLLVITENFIFFFNLSNFLHSLLNQILNHNLGHTTQCHQTPNSTNKIDVNRLNTGCSIIVQGEPIHRQGKYVRHRQQGHPPSLASVGRTI